ncbi:MAG: hypothetical protein S4CHLAM102_05860 [Chlamydiia bacterium]|nr:hypothetical protein [Chlamydiia bacterium]
MSLEYGIVPFTEPPTTTYWHKTLEEIVDSIESFTKCSQLQFTIRVRRRGTEGIGRLFMTYPFVLTTRPTQEQMEQQIARIRALTERSDLNQKECHQKLTEIRLAFFSRL